MSTSQPVHPPWFDPRMPRREDCVLKAILDDRAARVPERRIALFEDGTQWTWAECREHVRAQAAALQALGVRAGDRVVAWLPNGPALVRAWFAINYLGAVFVPLNTAYRGASLEHTINACRARLIIAHAALIERLEGLSLPHVERVITAGTQELEGDATRLDDSAQPQPWDAQSIIYTSGTTGLSKGVLSPYLQLYTTATVVYGYLREGEGILVNLPMFHVGGTSSLMIALIRSGSFHLVDGFSTDRFWDQVRRGNCATTSGLIGINEQTVKIRDRFGIDYLTGFNMTELSAPLVSELNTTVFGACGRPRTGVQCRLVDEHDVEVPDGTPGELIVRSDMPWTFNLGYDGLPDATARAWRNGWFHTGDAFRQDAEGNYYYVDRVKDAIRRRGENISSYEVEIELLSHPAVREAAAVAVPSEHGEDEVMAVLSLVRGARLDPAELIEFLRPRLAHFMIPRYVRITADLPKTPTQKAEKHRLRAEGVTPDTWDREAAGIRVRREKIGGT